MAGESGLLRTSLSLALAHSPTATVLDLVEGIVGQLQQRIAIRTVLRLLGNATCQTDAGSDLNPISANKVQTINLVNDFSRNCLGPGGIGIRHHQHEFVAAKARRHICFPARARRQHCADFHQGLISFKMAQAVIERLEVVQIDDQHADGADRTPGTTPRLGQEGLKTAAVGQCGQRVVVS